MNPPINLNFDLIPGSTRPDGIVHLMKIYQGAPYDQKISVKSLDGTYVRDFSSYTVRMQARLTQASPVLFELNSASGHFVGSTTGLQIVFPASVTDSLDLQTSASATISETKFIYDIELSVGGVVVERLAQGIGFIVANTTKGVS